MEFGYRFTFTDYLDDVSGIYPSSRQLSKNGVLAVALSNRTEEYTGINASHLVGQRRGNSNNNDGYFVWGLSLSFNLYGREAYKRERTPKRNYKINKWF